MDIPKERPRRPHYGFWVALVCVVLLLICQGVKPWTDNQWMNMGSYVLGAIALVSLSVWSIRRGSLLILRWIPTLSVIAAVALFLSLYKITGVTGELVPTFELRSLQRPPVASQGQGTADLQVMQVPEFAGFLGNMRNGVVPVREFSTDWTDAEVLWKKTVGPAWSGFAIAGDYAITQEQRGEGESGEQWITCYRIDDGELVWYQATPGAHYNGLGGTGPRGTPTIFKGNVYAQTAVGVVVCLDGATGQPIWQHDLFKRAGLTQAEAERAVTWGRSGSPLVVDTEERAIVVVPYGGPSEPDSPAAPDSQPETPVSSLIAFDAATGEVLWTGGQTQISYASPILATLDDQPQIVSVNESNVTGHALENGEVLWTADWPGASNGGANCASPIPYQSNQLLLGKGYGGGSKMLSIDMDAEIDERVTTEWADSRILKTKFTHAVLDGDLAYGLSDGTLECVDLRKPKRLWRQSRGDRYGQGQVLRIEDVLLAQSEPGAIALVRCDEQSFQELTRLPGLSAKTWNYPAVAGRILLIRNAREAIAYRLPPRVTPPSPSESLE